MADHQVLYRITYLTLRSQPNGAPEPGTAPTVATALLAASAWRRPSRVVRAAA